MADAFSNPRVAVWGAALFVLVALLVAAYFGMRLSLATRAVAARVAVGVVFVSILAASGWIIAALATSLLPSDVRVDPGFPATWGPAILATAVAATLFYTRVRKGQAT